MRLCSDQEAAQLVSMLTKSFKGGGYSEPQIKRLLSHFRRLTWAEGEKMIEDMAMLGNQAPTPIKVVETINEVIKKRNGGRGAPEEPKREPECFNCMETGLCFVDMSDIVTLMRCRCHFGKTCNEPDIPVNDRSIDVPVFKFPVEKFVPKKNQMNGPMTNWPAVQWWKEAKSVAREYWKKMGDT